MFGLMCNTKLLFHSDSQNIVSSLLSSSSSPALYCDSSDSLTDGVLR